MADGERVLPAADAASALEALVWMAGARAGSAASVYAMGYLAEALGPALVNALASFDPMSE